MDAFGIHLHVKKNETETNFYHFLRYLPDFYGDLFIDRNFSLYAHNDTNNQLIDHSDSLLITFRILIIAKFIKYILLNVYVKKGKDQTESVQRIRI